MEHVYKITEVTGSSKVSMEDAVRNAVERTSRSLRNLRWFKVTEVRGMVDEGTIGYWQVTVKIGFTVED